MVMMSENSEEEISRLHQDLCNKLNVDPNIVSSSWETYQSISKKFVLEGEKLHWLGCAIYVTSRRVDTPSLDNSTVTRGHGINLTSLLRHSNLSFVQFFSNITLWAEMAQLPDDFKNRINQLRSNFSISCNTFKKLQPLFSELFTPPTASSLDLDALKHRSRKNRTIPLTPVKLFEFIWNLFIVLKSEEPKISDQLVKCHHLLYCCIDLLFRNCVLGERRDLLNSAMSEELATFANEQDLPCIVKRFCDCESVIREALHMKAYTFRQLVQKIITNNIISADPNSFTGILDEDKFDQNFRNLSKAYERHLLSQGDFDERIFLAEFKRMAMEKEPSWTSMSVLPPGDSMNDSSIMESPKPGNGSSLRGLDTPLTGRKYLGPKENDLSARSATEKASRLHVMLGSRQPAPSEKLKGIFAYCQNNPEEKIEELIETMKKSFLDAYGNSDEGQSRAEYAEILFYKYVELILNKEASTAADIPALVQKDLFFQCMFACCLEIVLYCYNYPRKFPWILDVLGVEPVHFVKVIELIVRTKDNLFRELIKHLSRIEETVIESLAWKSNSPVWSIIENSEQGIPKYQDTALPGQLFDKSSSENPLPQSPGTPTATDCFQSPLSQICRTLFPGNGSSLQLQRQGTHFVLPDKDGKIKLLSVMDTDKNKQESNGNRRTGGLTFIFRKFYYIAGVRMQHLCSHLGFEDVELRRKIWTIFEDSIRHTDLIKDRHLDQLLMCAIYVIRKAANINVNNLFADIMRFYRQQPQARSSVYRDVLIERQKINENGDIVGEKREDLIQFYNQVYVKVMQTFAVRFQSNGNNNVALSPLPASRKTLTSSHHQVCGNVFVRPLETSVTQTGPTFSYYFSRSPSKDLMNINRAINSIQGKRLLIDDESNVPQKKISNRRIQSLVEERRQSSNASE